MEMILMQNEKNANKSKITRIIVRVVLLAAAILLLILGIMGNGFKDIKNKASMICYECIGIG